MVAVAIPNYNKALYIKECLSSVFAQTVPVEVFFYDDGSDDDSIEIVKRYKEFRMCNIHIYRSLENRGTARTVNRLADKVSEEGFERMAIVASDDTIHPDFLKKLHSRMDQGNSFVTCHAQVHGSENRVFRSKPGLTLEKYKEDSYLLTAGLYSLKMWRELEGRREDWRLTHDYEFFVRMLKARYDYDVVDEILYYWRNYPEQQSRTIANDKHLRIKAYEINNLKW